jgi:hypothetical protein
VRSRNEETSLVFCLAPPARAKEGAFSRPYIPPPHHTDGVSAWRDLPIMFPKTDLPRVPDHWRRFDTRKSPLSGSQRLAANPANAILNYLYAVLESETRLAVAALGLDPRLRSHGTCAPAGRFVLARLAYSRAAQAKLVFRARKWELPTDEHPCYRTGTNRSLVETSCCPARGVARSVKSNSFPSRICRGCGTRLKDGRAFCASCQIPISRTILIEAAKQGRVATHSPTAEALRASTQRRQVAARKAWNPSDQPKWLNEQVYIQQIQPALLALPNSAIARALSISMPYASDVRHGRRRPHPRHWQSLAELANVTRLVT